MGLLRDDGVLADLSLYQLSKLIRIGEIRSEQLVELYVRRIRAFDGKKGLNAFISVLEEGALKEAEKLDRLAKKKRFRGPLHGLPLAIKDNLDTKGIRTTGGSAILSDWRPSRDAHVVVKLKEAGAIILGKTNLHEFAFGVTNNNPHYGPTRNPYDRLCIPGGSSGGSAAATAAALCAGAIGTDTGGSVVIPAALCGVVGLKPTLGRVGRGGLISLSFTRDVVGPITRAVIDSALILEVVSGKDVRDPESSSKRVPRYTHHLGKSLRGKRFGVPRRYFFDGLHPDTEEVMGEAIREVESLGGTIREIEVKDIDSGRTARRNIFLPECVYLLEEYLKTFDPGATIEKYLDQCGPDVKAKLGSQMGTAGSKPVPGYAYVKALREDRSRMVAGFKGALLGLDALLLPTTPLPASAIGQDEEMEFNGEKVDVFETFTRNCYPVNLVGYPSITVPAGYGKTGLPIGLLMVTRPWEEERLLSIAHAFEQANGARVPPKLGQPT